MRRALLLIVLLQAFPVLAQESAGYGLNEHTLNAGGNPSGGVVLASTSYKITLDALGDAVLRTDLTSASFKVDGGFGSAYMPPGEVLGLRFSDGQTLVWNPERSVGVYNLYRGLINGLDGTVFGSCDQQDIATHTTTDGDPVPSGNGHFYLVSAENRLDEEGTLGRQSAGAQRPPASPCP